MDDLEERANRGAALVVGALFFGPLCAYKIYAAPVTGGAGALLGALVYSGELRHFDAAC